jgi:hypothetical protein
MMGGIMCEYAEQDNTRNGKQENTIEPAEMLDQHHRTSSLTMTHLHCIERADCAPGSRRCQF